MQEFFLVWCPDTGYTKHAHENFKSAKTEAERLASQNKGKEFIVLRTVSKSVIKKEMTQYFDQDDIPF